MNTPGTADMGNLAHNLFEDVFALHDLTQRDPASASAGFKAHAIAKLAELPLSEDDWLRLLSLARAQAVFTAFPSSLPADAPAGR